MFDLSFAELSVIGLIALVVLGPERLPKAARLAGLWVRRARAQWHSVKGELERELAAEELQRSLREARSGVEDIGQRVRDAGEETRKDFDSMRDALNEARRSRHGAAQGTHDAPAAGDTPGTDAGEDLTAQADSTDQTDMDADGATAQESAPAQQEQEQAEDERR